MTASPVRQEFAPPPTPGLLWALLLALLAHVLLLIVLALGVQWKRDAPPTVVEAELWSSVPKQAAPPPPPPVPVVPDPPPVKQVVEQPPVPKVPLVDPNIAIEQEKARQKQEKERQLRLAELEKEKRRREAEKIQKQKEEQAAREKEQREKLAREKQLQQARQKELAAKNALDAKNLDESRRQQIERMNRLANQAAGNGNANSMGSAKQSSGPSAGYGSKIVERIKSNTRFSDASAGRPSVKVFVQVTPTGSILNSKIISPSGNRAWDDAVLNAVEKLGILPPDVDGRIPDKVLKEGLELTVTL